MPRRRGVRRKALRPGRREENLVINDFEERLLNEYFNHEQKLISSGDDFIYFFLDW